MKKCVPDSIRILLVVMILSVASTVVFWLPKVLDYTQGFLNELGGGHYLTLAAKVLAAVISFIALLVFFVAFRFPRAIETDSIFTDKTAALLKLIACLLLADSILFGAVTVCLFVIGETLLSPVFAFFDLVGFCVTGMIFVLSGYVRDAAYLKEEVDGTL